jgi:hypothetical protein
MVAKMNTKHEVFWVSEKLEIVKKGDMQPCVTQMEVVEHLIYWCCC